MWKRPIRRLRWFAGQLSTERIQACDELLADCCRSFNQHCAKGIEPNAKRIQEHLDHSLMPVTALNPHIDYEKTARISPTAYLGDISLRDAALKLAFLTADPFDNWVRPEDMSQPPNESGSSH